MKKEREKSKKHRHKVRPLTPREKEIFEEYRKYFPRLLNRKTKVLSGPTQDTGWRA